MYIETDFKPGDKVTYVPGYGPSEIGIVKSISDNDHVFVVYHCNNEWNNYEHYTAARTRTVDLVDGWL